MNPSDSVGKRFEVKIKFLNDREMSVDEFLKSCVRIANIRCGGHVTQMAAIGWNNQRFLRLLASTLVYLFVDQKMAFPGPDTRGYMEIHLTGNLKFSKPDIECVEVSCCVYRKPYVVGVE